MLASSLCAPANFPGFGVLTVDISCVSSSNRAAYGVLPVVAVGYAALAGVGVRLGDMPLQPLDQLLHLWQGRAFQLRSILPAPPPNLLARVIFDGQICWHFKAYLLRGQQMEEKDQPLVDQPLQSLCCNCECNPCFSLQSVGK